jgi:hypothetical protein
MVLLFSLTPNPKRFFFGTGLALMLLLVGFLALDPSNVKSLRAQGNYYSCLNFINFDGLTCEIFFNTFINFRQTMFSVITITPVMAFYPLLKFFNLKHKTVSKSPDVLAFVLAFLIWLNFFFDPYNSEFELFFAISLVSFNFFSTGFAFGFICCLIYFTTSLMKAFNMRNYTETSYHESTSTNMFNYISFGVISFIFILSFTKLKKQKELKASKAKMNQIQNKLD